MRGEPHKEWLAQQGLDHKVKGHLGGNLKIVFGAYLCEKYIDLHKNQDHHDDPHSMLHIVSNTVH